MLVYLISSPLAWGSTTDVGVSGNFNLTPWPAECFDTVSWQLPVQIFRQRLYAVTLPAERAFDRSS